MRHVSSATCACFDLLLHYFSNHIDKMILTMIVFTHLLTLLCTVPIQLTAARPPSSIAQHQKHFAQIETIPKVEQKSEVPGHNNVTYGPVPLEDQLFQIESLEIAPSPIPLDQFFFVLLRGRMPKFAAPLQAANDGANATLSITISAALDNGNPEKLVTYTVPFRTTAFGENGYISIRKTGGPYVDYMAHDGRYDILADCQLPSMFVRPGTWTFEIVTKLEDDTCLFALSLTQWLPGRLRE
ncbi:hypothetical protein F5B22DRAFT_603767 [Xylaria bambusicola]|uniref:uncharacterized protein n=1 Tax=Xylaria bambusicola TaxID=326684 RepID=UPI002007F6CB|nr:uncharacterized protein F5B22DRAFT_603767 [Xylaria bambusicola]KAI0517223.1 hypothetical protein F5B22DRAFT_603767 [Xylaria bambusicola]